MELQGRDIKPVFLISQMTKLRDREKWFISGLNSYPWQHHHEVPGLLTSLLFLFFLNSATLHLIHEFRAKVGTGCFHVKLFNVGRLCAQLHNQRTFFCLQGEKVILANSNFPFKMKLVLLFHYGIGNM